MVPRRCSVDHLGANLHQNQFIHFQNTTFTSLVITAAYGQKDGREYNTSARRSHWPGEGITTVTVQTSTQLKTSRNEVLV